MIAPLKKSETINEMEPLSDGEITLRLSQDTMDSATLVEIVDLPPALLSLFARHGKQACETKSRAFSIVPRGTIVSFAPFSQHIVLGYYFQMSLRGFSDFVDGE